MTRRMASPLTPSSAGYARRSAIVPHSDDPPVAERQLARGELVDDYALAVQPAGSRCSMARVANAPSSFWTRRSIGRPSDVAQLLGEPGRSSPAHRLERIDVGEAVAEHQHVRGTIGPPRRSIRLQDAPQPDGLRRKQRAVSGRSSIRAVSPMLRTSTVRSGSRAPSYGSATPLRSAPVHPPWLPSPRAASACRSRDTAGRPARRPDRCRDRTPERLCVADPR